MVYLTRRERFNAAHKLWVEQWSEEKNYATFGKCANKNWHGHNYWLYVTPTGSTIARRAPASCNLCTAKSIPLTEPEMTNCPGQL